MSLVDVLSTGKVRIETPTQKYRQAKYGLPPTEVYVRTSFQFDQIKVEWYFIDYLSNQIQFPFGRKFEKSPKLNFHSATAQTVDFLSQSKYSIRTSKSYEHVLQCDMEIFISDYDLLRMGYPKISEMVERLIMNQIRRLEIEDIDNLQ